MDKISTNKRNHFWVFSSILALLSLFMIFVYQPLCPGQDYFFHARRLQALIDGLFDNPFMIYLDYAAVDGYGYFTKAFYPDLLLIPFALIGYFTGFTFAYQLLIFTFTFLCGIFTYKAVNYIYNNPYAAAISALLYTFCIYRLLDIYNRAAIGEAMSFTFVPIVFLGLYHIIKGDYRKWYIIAIGFSLMIFTHLISSVLMFITVLIFCAIYWKSLFRDPKRIYYLLLAGGITIILTAYYIFPMLEQMLSNTFYYESRDIMSKTEDATDGLHWIIWGMFTGIVHPYQVFIPGIGIFLTLAIALRLFVNEKTKELRSVDIGVIVGLVYIFAVSNFFPWSVYPFKLLNFIQIPWRLYEFSSFLFAVAGGYYISRILITNKRRLLNAVILVIGLTVMMLSDSQFYHEIRSNRPITQQADITNDYHLGGLEYFPEKLPSIQFVHQRGNVIIPTDEKALISNIERERGKTSFDLVSSGNNTSLELPLTYYKGYKATLNNKEIPVSESKNGLIQVSSSGSGKIDVYYGGTTTQKGSWFITLISIAALCVYIIFIRRKEEKET
ncbi:MAG: hypothetical protein LBV43_05915 [Prevotella sp.]|nr:hypothetical protein [Prevotella sp.]